MGNPDGCDNPVFKKFPLQHSLGGDPQPKIKSLQECQDKCKECDSCIALDWNLTENPYTGAKCWHHSGPHPGVLPNKGADHYAKTCPAPKPQPIPVNPNGCDNPVFKKFPLQHSLGGDPQPKVKSLQECQAKCKESDSCIALDWNL